MELALVLIDDEDVELLDVLELDELLEELELDELLLE